MRTPTLTYSNVVASLALFVALGGTSYAVSRNSVGTKELKDDAVTSRKIRDGSVSARELADDARIAGPRGPRGAVGPQGGEGQRGIAGAQGERGPSNTIVTALAANQTLPGTAFQTREVRRIENVPAGAWRLSFSANAYSGTPLARYAVCALKVNGDTRGVSSAVVGIAAQAVQEVGVPIEVAVSQPAAFNATVDCHQDQNGGTNPDVIIVRAQLMATQVAQVTTAP